MTRSLLLALFWVVASGAAAQIHVRSGLIVPTEVAPGAEDEAAIELFNAGTEAVHLRVYLQDLAFDRGRPAYGDPGTAPRSNAGWLSMPATVLTVLPGQTALVPYTTRVPDDPALVGSYWSVALVEEVLPEAPATTEVDAIVIVGDSAVGKSSLLNRFANRDRPFSENYNTTVSVDFHSQQVSVDGRTVAFCSDDRSVHLWARDAATRVTAADEVEVE